MTRAPWAACIGQILTSAALCLGISACAAPPSAPPGRLERIQQRGALGCGIEPAVPGFAERDAQGRYRGLDIDVCRAIAAAIFGAPDRINFVPASSVEEFLRDDNVDVIARRITWELKREGSFGLLFGPVTFHDGQSFLVRKNGKERPTFRSADPVCVAGGTVFETNLNAYAARRSLALDTIFVASPHGYDDIAARLASGECRAYSGDVSDLGAIRSKLPAPAAFEILDEMISKEPLAPLVRQTDGQFFTVVRWTIFALIAAEELGVTSSNVDQMRASNNLDVRRLLGVQSGNGKSLGLREDWASNAIKAVGNYGEIFERNLGTGSAIKLNRGLNRLFKNGGLMYAPPLR